jgi:glycosyltransferase involved in cell wall biosynthesis
MSLVDVVIPCYKYGRYLRDCVESVLTQEGVDVRALIIDDCSPDDTPRVAAQLVAEDSRVEYRRHAVNRGHIATYNEGLLEWADSDYCLLLSADDLLTPGALRRAAQLMDSHPEVVFTCGREIKTAEPRADDCPHQVDGGFTVFSGDDFLLRMCREAENIVSTPTAVVRTCVQQRIGGYRADLPHSGDMEMWLRFAAHGSVGTIHAFQAFYRTHGQNMSCGYVGLRDLRSRKDAFEAIFSSCGHRINNCRYLQSLASKNLADLALWAASRSFERGELPTCRQYTALATEFSPTIRRTARWQRFRLKQMIGAKTWSRIGPTARRLRAPLALLQFSANR